MILEEPPLANVEKREKRIVTVNHKVVRVGIATPTEVHFYVGDYEDAESSAILKRLSIRSWNLSCVGTKPECQRQGLSRQVLNAVKIWLASRYQSASIVLDTTSQVAKEFYESEGFTVSRHGIVPQLRTPNTASTTTNWRVMQSAGYANKWEMRWVMKERGLS